MKFSVMIGALLLPAAMACADRSIDETKPADPESEIEISIVTGSLVITGWDRNEIRVTGTLGDDVEEFIFDIDDEDVEIKVKLPDRKRRVNGKADLEISVPAASVLEARTVSAPITVRALYGGEIELKAVSGKISVQDCRGEVNADVVSGSIDIDGDHDVVKAESVSGSITIHGVTSEVDAETVSGSITVTASALEEVKLEALSGRVRYEGGLSADGELDMEAFSGSAIVEFTNEVFGEYEIETFNGKIENEFGPEPRKKSKYGPGYELEFTHGDGDARVRINSFSGKVILRNK